MRARMASASATVLTPLCLRMATDSAALPLSVDDRRGIGAGVLDACRRRGCGSGCCRAWRRRGRRSPRAGAAVRPCAPTARARPVRAGRPAARGSARAAPRRRRWSRARRRSGDPGSILTWICRRRAPNRITSPTPLTDSRRFWTFCSRKRRELDRGHRRRDREHHDRHRVRILLLHDRRVGGLGQVADDRIDLGPHFLRGDVGVLRQVEGDGDARLAFGRRRPQLVDAGDGVDRRFDPVGDLLLDALGRRARVGWSSTDTTGVSMRG